MYHRIDVSPINSLYYVSPAKFEEQIKLLHDWEYTAITTEMLVKAITEGASLPPRPVIITFDDGNIDNYNTALPIMQKYGFTGVLYIVANYVGADQYMNAEQIVEMYNAGWEVGSHSVSHQDLTTIKPDRQRFEIVESREKLQSQLSIPILTFAYPYGKEGNGVVDCWLHCCHGGNWLHCRSGTLEFVCIAAL
jgi:peptidoglycan/xylan/chitin deacetylase (PgdA/CDA1 family)